MKREELKAKGLTDEQITFVMDENGKDINGLKATIGEKDQTIATLTTERDGLKTQVTDRDKDIAELKKQTGNTDELNQKLTDLQNKYDTDTKDLQAKLTAQAREHAAEQFYAGVQFTSAFAKKAAMAEFAAANLELKDGKFVCGEEFLKKQQTDNPDAFKPKEDPKPDPAPNTKPQFADPKPQQNPPKPTTRLADLMKQKNDNPNTVIKFD